MLFGTMGRGYGQRLDFWDYIVGFDGLLREMKNQLRPEKGALSECRSRERCGVLSRGSNLRLA